MPWICKTCAKKVDAETEVIRYYVKTGKCDHCLSEIRIVEYTQGWWIREAPKTPGTYKLCMQGEVVMGLTDFRTMDGLKGFDIAHEDGWCGIENVDLFWSHPEDLPLPPKGEVK